MDDWVEISRDERHIRRERAKARELRKTPYYRNLFRKGICHYCGKKFPPEELTLDHIVCCRSCNQEKKFLTPAELLLRRLSEEPESES